MPPSTSYTPPTSTELHTLSSQLFPQVPPDTSAASLLLPLLNCLSPQWISDFLFTSHPTHVPHLTSPHMPDAALLCEVRTTSIEHDKHYKHISGSFLLVPAFIVGNLTVGFGVMDGCEMRSTPEMEGRFDQRIRFRNSLRFVKHSTHRFLVTVQDGVQNDCIMISACWHERITESRSITVRLKRGLFLDTLSRNAGRVELCTLTQSFRSVSEQRQYRMCPECGAQYMHGCACALVDVGRGHCYDWEWFKTDFGRDFGEFEGTGVRIGKNGRLSRFVVMSELKGMRNEASVREFSAWAIARGFCAINPGAIGIMGRDEDVVRKMREFAVTEPEKLAFRTRGMQLPVSVHGRQYGWEGEGGGLYVGGSGVVIAEDKGEGKNWGMEPFNETIGMDGAAIFGGDERRQRDGVGDENLMRTRGREGAFGMETDTSSAPITSRGGGVDNSIVIGKGSPATKIEEVLTSEMLEKRRRALNRRERNRQAAQRSNLRKKLERDAMKSELITLQDKEETLREREATLRRENVLLLDLVKEKAAR